eukprot:13938021-Heterocapsa_arctica.AAC.1
MTRTWWKPSGHHYRKLVRLNLLTLTTSLPLLLDPPPLRLPFTWRQCNNGKSGSDRKWNYYNDNG